MKNATKQIPDTKEAKEYFKKLLNYMDKNLPHNHEDKDMTEIERIHKIAEGIEKGKINK